MTDLTVMHEFETGKGKWNHLRICWDEDHDEIVIKDDLGYIRFDDSEFDEFFEGVQRIKDKLDSRKFGFDSDEEDEVESGGLENLDEEDEEREEPGDMDMGEP